MGSISCSHRTAGGPSTYNNLSSSEDYIPSLALLKRGNPELKEVELTIDDGPHINGHRPLLGLYKKTTYSPRSLWWAEKSRSIRNLIGKCLQAVLLVVPGIKVNRRLSLPSKCALPGSQTKTPRGLHGVFALYPWEVGFIANPAFERAQWLKPRTSVGLTL